MTSKFAFPALDILHAGMMLVALAVAYALPFELVLLSYAILGPLHYLTEISWLHDRSYFMQHRSLAWFLALCTVVVLALSLRDSPATGIIFCLALAFSAAFTLFGSFWARAIVILIGLGAGLVVSRIPPLNTPLIILLPTVIHVSIFTLLFMVVGALRGKSFSQAVLVLLYMAGITTLLFYPPVVAMHIPVLATRTPQIFGSIAKAFRGIFGGAWPFDARLAGFLSFIYTYHYLNWFIKVRVIKWDAVSRERLLMIFIMGLGATSFYFINYDLGFVILFTLSLLHVMLEFPLNVLSIRQLGGLMRPLRSSLS